MKEDFWNSEEISKRYEHIKPLGSGGMGTVYLAKDNALEKLVAIKVLDADLTPLQSIRFQREGKLSGRLNHENIVSVLDFGVSNKNIPFLVMEYLPGSSLGVLIKQNGGLELDDALPIFIEICAGMIHSHSNGISHRDLKPENIIVSDFDNDDKRKTKIVDFGIARLTENDAQVTQTGAMLGSPLYMAPEQTSGEADERSDIYAMGCLMFATLTGEPPFIGETPLETLMLHKSEAPESLSESANRAYPEEAERIVANCLRKNPDDRYQSFLKLQGDLTPLELTLRLAMHQASEKKDDSDASANLSSVWRILNKTKYLILFVVIAIPLATVLINFIFREHQDLPPPVDSEIKPARIFNTQNNTKQPELGEPVIESEKAPKSRDVAPFKISMEDGFRIVQSNLTSVSDNDLSELSNSPMIHKLILKRTQVTGVGFKNWKTYVRSLFLDGSPVSYDGLQQVRALPALQALSLRQVSLTPECLRLLATGNLSTFFFSNIEDSKIKLTEQSLSQLSASKTISILEVGGMQISEKGMESLLSIKTLQSLRLVKCDLTDSAYQRLQKPNQLVNISFIGQKIDKVKLEKILKSSIPRLALHEVTIEPAVLMSLKGNHRISYMDVTSPGISNEKIEEMKNSFSKDLDIGIVPERLNGILDETIKAGELQF